MQHGHSPSDSLFELCDVGCVLADGTRLFSPMSLSVQPGQSVLIEGGSGQGKSSLLFHLRGIEGEAGLSFSGHARWRGKELAPKDRDSIGLVLQNPHSQMLCTLVSEELRSGLGESGGPDAPRRLGAAISILGLQPLLQSATRALSAGQKHLVAIGCIGAIAHPLLLLDEPFLYVDRSGISRIMAYIRHLCGTGVSVIVASHPEVVSNADFDQSLSLRSGRSRWSVGGSCHSESDTSGTFTESVGRGDRIIDMVGADIAYEERANVVEDANLSIASGEEIWLLGENGTGKTSFLKTLHGQIPPVKGQVAHRGGKGRHKTYLISQNPDRAFFQSTVLRELSAPLAFEQPEKSEKDFMEQAMVHLRALGLQSKESLCPSQLSFGERVRLAFAQASLLKPDFLLIDDILASMAEDERDFLLASARRMQRRYGCGLVFASSNGAFAPAGDARIFALEKTPGSPCSRLSTVSDENALAECAAHRSSGMPESEQQKKKRPTAISSIWKPPAFEYVADSTRAHAIPLAAKIAICIAVWIPMASGSGMTLAAALAASALGYLLSGLGWKRLLADSRYFILQAMFFALILPIVRWDISAVAAGLLCGAKVWGFFLPLAVLARTTTCDQWMSMYRFIASRERRIALGISMSLLPAIVGEIREISQMQRSKGYILARRDLVRPRRVWEVIQSLFLPMILIIDDAAHLAELAVSLRGMDREAPLQRMDKTFS